MSIMPTHQLPLDLNTVVSDWKPVSELPDWRGRPILAIDTEERDNGLANDKGSSWAWATGRPAEGYIAGITVTVPERSIYVPLHHPDSPECFQQDQVTRWLTDITQSAGKVVTHYGDFDWGWLGTIGVPMPPRMEDTHVAAVMINENRLTYNLDDLCEAVGLPGKDETLLRDAAIMYNLQGFNARGRPNGSDKLTNKKLKSQLWRLPARFAAPYAEQDGTATLGLWGVLEPMLTEEEVLDAYRLEINLMPMVRAMRAKGIRINDRGVLKSQAQLTKKLGEQLITAGNLLDGDVTEKDLNSAARLEPMFTKLGIEFPRTTKTEQASFTKKFMSEHPHPFPQAITRARQILSMRDKFLGTYILGNLHTDASGESRIHAEINQLRGGRDNDDSLRGTRSYRLSYSDPPLQQAPSMDDELAPIIRSAFDPEPDTYWMAADYSQQEYRLTVHFAYLCKMSGSDAAVRAYLENPDLDYHQMVAEWTGLTRKKAKAQNFAILYGQGLEATAASLGVTVDEAMALQIQYKQKLPFGPALAEFCKKRADWKGRIRLIDGAKCRFDLWEPYWSRPGKSVMPLSKEDAQKTYPNTRLKRSGVQKAMNRLVQGSAARQMKKAMYECWRAGLLPMIQMHDELCFSANSQKTGHTVTEVMLDAIKLEVPMKVDIEWGRTWGDAKHTWEDLHAGT